MGISTGPALDHPAVQLKNKMDGVISEDGQIIGTYLHGLFDKESALHSLLSWAGLGEVRSFDYEALREQELNRLANEMEEHIDIESLFNTCR